MDKTTSELTIEYIKEHPYIKNCLKNGLINYSSLSRLISEELKLGKKTSKEAILIAARRFRERLKKEVNNEHKIKFLLTNSEMDIKNKICVLILDKDIDLDYIINLQRDIHKENGTIFLLEGHSSYTLITQDKYFNELIKRFKNNILKSQDNLAIINFKSPQEIEGLTGVVAYLTSLFSENGINIIEFSSCWKDTIFVIDSKNVNKAINFLNF